LAGFALLLGAQSALPQDFVLPAVSALFFAAAAGTGLIAWASGQPFTWTRQQGSERLRLTHWDIAGAFVFIGICVTALVEPEQMTRVVEAINAKP
jgi:hypothetical protein